MESFYRLVGQIDVVALIGFSALLFSLASYRSLIPARIHLYNLTGSVIWVGYHLAMSATWAAGASLAILLASIGVIWTQFRHMKYVSLLVVAGSAMGAGGLSLEYAFSLLAGLLMVIGFGFLSGIASKVCLVIASLAWAAHAELWEATPLLVSSLLSAIILINAMISMRSSSKGHY